MMTFQHPQQMARYGLITVCCFMFMVNAYSQSVENAPLPLEFRYATSLLGSDTNGNGIRDDLERWIANRSDMQSHQKKALEQAVRALQATLVVDLKVVKPLETAAYSLSAAYHCIVQSFPTEEAQGYHYALKIEQLVMNNKERIRRFSQYNAATIAFPMPLLIVDTCNNS